jgi:PAS domain S-box-containing protein
MASATDSWYFEHSPDAIVVVDAAGVIELVNPKAEEMFGYEAADMTGQPVELLVPREWAASHQVHRRAYIGEPRVRLMGQPRSQLHGRRADGTDFPVEISLSPVRSDEGLRVLACVRDVTDRVRLETQTRRVSDALDAVHEAVFMFEPDSLRFTYVNDGAVEQVGYSRAELLDGMTPLQINPEFTAESFRTMISRLVAGERNSLTFNTTLLRKDHDEVVVEVALQYHRSDGSLDGVMVALARDITDRHAAELRARADREARRVAEDRERIGRDLHDVVIQRLFAAGMRLQSALPDPELLAQRSDETIAELDETIAVIRKTIFALTDKGTSSPSKRIQETADAHTDRTGVMVDVELSGDVDGIDDLVMAGLQASLTEALSNVARHAAAQEVRVSVDVGEEVVLQVTDDGVGITGSPTPGFGLPNIEARAVELGGQFTISRGPEGGTRVEWRVPAGGAASLGAAGT